MDHAVTIIPEEFIQHLNNHARSLISGEPHDLELRVAMHQTALTFRLIEIKRTCSACLYRAPNGIFICSCYNTQAHHIGEDGYHFACVQVVN